MEELEIQPQGTPEPEQAPEPETAQETAQPGPQTVSIEEWKALSEPGVEEPPQPEALEDVQLLAVLEACVYVAEEPLMPEQIAAALNQDPERIRALLQQLMAEFDRPEHGVSIKEVAGGYKMATKPEHHEAVRSFVKSLKTPLKLSLPALETLAVIAYKQPVTTPEIMEIRGVQGGGVLKTLLDRKLITEAGRKNVIGKPILYKTTKEFLIQFGLKDLSELPSLKEFEEIRRMAMADSEGSSDAPGAASADGEAALAAEVPISEAETADAQPEARAPEAEAAAPEAETAIAQPEASATEAQAAVPEAETADAQPETPAPQAETPAPEGETADARPEAPATEAETPAPEGETADAQPEDRAPETEAAAPEAETADAQPEARVPEAAVAEPAESAPEATAPEEPPPAESQER